MKMVSLIFLACNSTCVTNLQVSSITFNVFIAAKTNANYVWLNLSTAQNQILNIMESIIFMVGLTLGEEVANAQFSKSYTYLQATTHMISHIRSQIGH